MVVDLRSDALRCYSTLVGMVDRREPCDGSHLLRRLMRNLQRRHNGVFPTELRVLWDRVRLPEQPDAPFYYHDGIERLCDYFDERFTFKGMSNDGGDSDRDDEGSGVVNWSDVESRIVEVEEGLGSGEESDPGDDANSSGAEGFEEAV